MIYAYLESIDESVFLSCISAPTEEQLAEVVASLSEYPHPAWASDPQAWIRQRFAQRDWYSDLEDPRPWELAIAQLVHRPEFGFQYSDGETTLLTNVIEWSRKAFRLLDESAVLRSFKPFRYFLSEERELELTYWPYHAQIANDGVGRLIGELDRFDVLLEMLEQNRPGFKDINGDEIEAAQVSIARSIPVLKDIYARGRMLYAPFEV